jgi:hypothetical protein
MMDKNNKKTQEIILSACSKGVITHQAHHTKMDKNNSILFPVFGEIVSICYTINK